MVEELCENVRLTRTSSLSWLSKTARMITSLLYLPFGSRLFLFSSACVSGFLFAFIWHQYLSILEFSLSYHQPYNPHGGGGGGVLRDTHYNTWFHQFNLTRHSVPEEEKSFLHFDNAHSEATFLFNQTSVLCVIFVKTIGTTKAINATWAQHCNHRIFLGPLKDKTFPVLEISRPLNFYSLCKGFFPLWSKYKGQVDWVLFADDKTFAILENLRHYVAPLNSSRPYYLGYAVKTFSATYNIADAGIAISQGTMALLEQDFRNPTSCNHFGFARRRYDQGLGSLLAEYSVVPQDTRDARGRGRFNPFSFEKLLIPGQISTFNSFWKTSAYPNPKSALVRSTTQLAAVTWLVQGGECCSPRAITFHDLACSELYLLYYLVYHLRPFVHSPRGLGNGPPAHLPDTSSPSMLGHSFVQPLLIGLIQPRPKRSTPGHHWPFRDGVYKECP
ncbi:hypothetical protein LAZ67_20002495 [Cordylochernes scorpioides]|uniref:Uncharacterized protein n=1 Tax=Cordylochernes scorpioides TaxID=51811 RepID=A0ABY6LN40_9ARAC|nr:hypothetical protein LAZ67_20002495 [Cordylochernes scorpioides]